ncbi:glycosyltransferase [Ferrimicrobium sp.]|uniref:glycosyltransferase n=1 Tax=Ferrimicrobium sp. TaxID=2926050 RepID=UPI0026050DAB|nr:glycosyltransferase [Ferrimicrobium sp.]
MVVWEIYFTWRLFFPQRIDQVLSPRVPLDGVEVVIPAHNEAATLPKLLASLDAQKGVNALVTVIDDRSSDETCAIAQSLGVEVLQLHDRRGNNPKAGALSNWIPKGTTETVVFLDADVDLVEAHALVRLVAVARGRPNDLISVQPYHRMGRWYEQFAFFPNLVSMVASGAFGAFGLGYSAATFGPVLCCQVAQYQRVGGHAVVMDSVLDDQALGQRFRGAGGHTVLFGGRGWVEFRMYANGFGQLLEGFRKNVAKGALMVRGFGALLATLMVVGQLSALATLASVGVKGLPAALVVIGLVCLVNTLVARRIGAFHWSSVCFQLVYLPIFLWMVATSGFDLLRGMTTWKGQAMRTRR